MTADDDDALRRQRALRQAEQQRVRALIGRDRRDREIGQARALAELEVRHGIFVNIADSVDEPTPEWLEKGEVRPYTPRQPDGTVRVVTTVRRVLKPIVTRLHNAGKITDEQKSACLWYRGRFDLAGLEGRYKTSHISLTGTAGGAAGAGQAPIALHEFEAEARARFRAARASLPAFYLRFFEAVVLDDIPPRRAARFARCSESKAEARFRQVADALVAYCRGIDIIR